MARKCEVSGKGPMSGNSRSHALNATKRKWNVMQLRENGMLTYKKLLF